MTMPTRYKAKLPKTLSYPIGAEIITAELAGCPQYDLFRLSFSMGWDAPNVRSGKPFRVIEIQYRNLEPSFSSPTKWIEEGWYDPYWELTIYPTLRDLKNEVRRALLAGGFTAVRNWLAKLAHPLPTLIRREFVVTFDPVRRKMTSAEKKF